MLLPSSEEEDLLNDVCREVVEKWSESQIVDAKEKKEEKIAPDHGCVQHGGIPPCEEKLVSHHRIRHHAGLNHPLGGSSTAQALSSLRLNSPKRPARCALCIDSTTSDLVRRLMGGREGVRLLPLALCICPR
nr:PREDICTED: coiled-coil domain-containing protein 43 isoform X2 [Haliaeetus albicilla]